MSYNVSTGVSNAASGAASGFSVGGPIGAGIGGAIGLASGFFGGGGSENDARDRAIRENRDLLQMLEERFQAAEARDPTDTALYEIGTAAAYEQADEQADRQAEQAAARGTTGSQLSVAQAGQRGDQLASSMRDFVVQGDQVQRQEERQALQSMLQQRQSLNALMTDAARAESRRNQRQQGAISSAFSNVTSAALSNPELVDALG